MEKKGKRRKGKKAERLTNGALAILLTAIAFIAAFSPVGENQSAAAGRGAYYGGTAGVSLMVNVYEGEEYVYALLKVLEEKGAKATFFFGGTFATRYPEAVRAAASRGHEIGSHGYSHRDHAKLSVAENEREIVKAEVAITAACGVKPTLFAPPAGSFSSATVKACENLGYRVIMWTSDTIDWRDRDAAVIFERAAKNVKSGDFILTHPTPETVQAFPLILEAIRANDLKPVTVSENLGKKAT